MSLRRLSGHCGLRDPDRPLLGRACAPPAERIAALAKAGFGGAFDNGLTLRSDRWIEDLAGAAAAHGLALTSFVHDAARWNAPGWIDGSALDALPRTIAVAQASGVRVATCVTAPLPGMERAAQLEMLAGNLARAADRAGRIGLVLALEATHPAFAPGLLVERLADALAVVRRADHPHVRVMLDLGHVLLHGEDPLAAVAAATGLIGGVQWAEPPHRTEPGSGKTDWPAIAAALARAGWHGPIEIEAEPACTDPSRMLRRLAALGLWPDRPWPGPIRTCA